MYVDFELDPESKAGEILLAPPNLVPDKVLDAFINRSKQHIYLLLDASGRLVGLRLPDMVGMLPESFIKHREHDVQIDQDEDEEEDEVYVTFGPLSVFIEYTYPCVFPELRGMVNFDFDPHDHLVGLEVVDASSLLHL